MTDDLQPPNEIGRIAAGDLLTRARNRYPSRTAFVEAATGESVTYRAFDDRVDRLAQALLDDGLTPGDRLAVLADNSLEFVTTYFAALRAGIVFVPISTELSPDDVRYEVEHADVDRLVVEDTVVETVETAIASSSADVEWFAVIDREGGADRSVPTTTSVREGHPSTTPTVAVEADDAAAILYTSGTTSRPKGVVHAHRALVASANNWCYHFDLGHRDTVGCWLPLFHVGQLCLTTGAVHAGATTVLQRGFDPGTILDDIETFRITVTHGTAMMYKQLRSADSIDERDRTSLRTCIYGLPLEQDELRRCIDAFDAEFPAISGQTEATTPTFVWEHGRQLKKEGNVVGRSALNVDATLLDDDGNRVDRGEIGEIAYRGPCTMKGYLDDETKTREAFEDGWMRSEDLGRVDEDGDVEFVGRKKDVIKTGGENVSVQKVEDVLREHPAVKDVAVVGLPHDRWGEAVTAFVLPVADEQASADALETFTRESEELAGFERPKAITFVEELPRTQTGKVQGHELVEEYREYYE